MSNTRVVKASKLINGIDIDNAKYNPEEMFMNSNLFKIDE